MFKKTLISFWAVCLFSGSAYAGELIEVKAKGLVCEFCVRTLEKMFAKRPEVEKISIDLTTKVIGIRLKDGQKLDDATIEKVIKDSGYALGEFEKK